MSSDNNDNTPSTPDQRTRTEVQLMARFTNLVTNALEEIRQREDEQRARGEPWSQYQLEPAEKEVLLTLNNFGLKEGVAAAALTLLALRRFRARFLQRLLRRRDLVQQAQAQKAKQQPPPTQPPPQSHAPHSPFAKTPTPSVPPAHQQQQSSSSFSPLANLVGWMVDTTVASMVGGSVSLLCIDPDQIRDTFASVPLVPGRSRLSDEFCPRLLREIKAMQQESNLQKEVLSDPQTPYLQSVVKFGDNCRRRQRLERTLRQVQGLGPSAPVSIPEPGVPVVAGMSDDDFEEEEGDQQEANDFYDPTSENEDTQWADDMVSDKNDSSLQQHDGNETERKGRWWGS